MDQTTRVNPMPPAPIFGVAPGAGGDGGSGGMGGAGKFINIDEIFADCFMDGEGDLLGLGGTGSQGGGVEGQGGAGVVGGGSGGGRAAAAAAGGVDQLGLNPNAAISSSGGLHAGTFGMGSPAMMQAQQFQQQQQQQLNPLGGMPMFMGRSAAAEGLTGGGALGGVPGAAAAQGVHAVPGRTGRAGAAAATGRGGTLAAVAAAAKPKAKTAATPAASAAASGTGGRGRGRGRGKGGAQSGRGVGSGAAKGGRGGGTAGARGAAAAAAAALSMQSAAMSGMDDDDDEDDDEGMGGKRGSVGGKRPRQGGRNMTEQQRLDRRYVYIYDTSQMRPTVAPSLLSCAQTDNTWLCTQAGMLCVVLHVARSGLIRRKQAGGRLPEEIGGGGGGMRILDILGVTCLSSRRYLFMYVGLNCTPLFGGGGCVPGGWSFGSTHTRRARSFAGLTADRANRTRDTRSTRPKCKRRLESVRQTAGVVGGVHNAASAAALQSLPLAVRGCLAALKLGRLDHTPKLQPQLLCRTVQQLVRLYYCCAPFRRTNDTPVRMEGRRGS